MRSVFEETEVDEQEPDTHGEEEDGISRTARVTDPVTSHQAAKSIKARTVQRLYLAILQICGIPQTDADLCEELAFENDSGEHHHGIASPSGVRTRRHELVDCGCIVQGGCVYKTEPGKAERRHLKWETTDLGAMVLAKMEVTGEPFHVALAQCGGVWHKREKKGDGVGQA